LLPVVAVQEIPLAVEEEQVAIEFLFLIQQQVELPSREQEVLILL
tara:strand:+ start:78 stop:212 length:135 start_codon:yes stop_codon:yes gene_type:complete